MAACCAQAFLTKLLTVDLPGLIVLPKRLDINIPPAVTAVAEAAVGRDAVMRAVASAVLQVASSSQDVLHTEVLLLLPSPEDFQGRMPHFIKGTATSLPQRLMLLCDCMLHVTLLVYGCALIDVHFEISCCPKEVPW